MGDVKVKEVKKVEPIQIERLSNIDPLTIEKIQNIAPAAVHIKELNHIDPISVDSLRIDEIRNLDPIRVERFDVTNLPTVNLSLRQLPSVDLNVRRLPPVSVGLHQDFCLPSNYTVRARLLGIEFLRVNIDGRTVLRPRERARREQSRSHQHSFAEVAAAGNPAIPSVHEQKGAVVHATGVGKVSSSCSVWGSSAGSGQGTPGSSMRSGALSFGAPRTSFSAEKPGTGSTYSESRVGGGGE